jgi:hypothetical protein
MWKQRSSLTYVPSMGIGGTIFFAHGSVYETGGGRNGYAGGIVSLRPWPAIPSQHHFP